MQNSAGENALLQRKGVGKKIKDLWHSNMRYIGVFKKLDKLKSIIAIVMYNKIYQAIHINNINYGSVQIILCHTTNNLLHTENV